MSVRSRYNRVKRKARREYNLTQRQYFSDLAKTQPQSFWKELKKVKKNNSTNTNCTNISEDDFLNHFEELFGDNQVFTNADVENHIHIDDVLNNIDQLDNEFPLTEVLKAIYSLKRVKVLD